MTYSARQRVGRGRGVSLARLLVWIVAWGSFAVDVPPVAAQSLFESYEVVTGLADRPTVMTGFLLDGPVAELAVVDVGESADRRLDIYTFEDGIWVAALDATLSSEVMFVDVARIGGRDRLITYVPGRLNWFDPETVTERPLVAASSSFDPPRSEEIPHVDITHDLNADGRDDLVVPDFDGFWVFVQTEDRAFATPVKIGDATDMSGIYGSDGYRYDPWSLGRIHQVDYNRDERNDLVFWNEDHFEVHIQDERGLFSEVATTFTTSVAFDSDDLFSLADGDMTGRVLHSLKDLNADGIADMVVVSLEGVDLAHKASLYELHPGVAAAEGSTDFEPGVGMVFRSPDRIQIAMEPHDFDGDGQLDLMFTTIEVDDLSGSLWKTIKGFMGDDIRLNLEFYRAGQDRFSETPTTIRTIALDGVPSHREPGWVPLDIVLRGATHEPRRNQESWPRAFNSTLLIGDVTGDGLSDLVLGQHPTILNVLTGVPGDELFPSQSIDFAIDVPNDEEYIWLADLNRDGKQDVVMHYPFTERDAHGTAINPPGTDPHRLVTLIAR